MTTPLALTPALQAYRTTAGTAAAGAGAAAGGVGGLESFDSVLGRVVQDTVQSARAADTATQSALTGQLGTTEVVMTVTRAELALQTAVAMRDRVVAAYQDVMRMGI